MPTAEPKGRGSRGFTAPFAQYGPTVLYVRRGGHCVEVRFPDDPRIAHRQSAQEGETMMRVGRPDVYADTPAPKPPDRRTRRW
jgi:hypothetical protein